MATGFVNCVETCNVTGAVERYAKGILENYAAKMPGGKFWNCHDSLMSPAHGDKCHGIGLTLDGKVVALYKSLCCLNPLFFYKDGEAPVVDGVVYPVGLSTWSCGGNFVWQGSWEKSVKKFNDESYFGHDALIAIYPFED